MHPPFFVVDHKIGPDIQHQSECKPVVRRGAPKALILSHSAPGWPPVPLIFDAPDVPMQGLTPLNQNAIARPQLCVVPPAQPTLRHLIGRLLIRTGQRMILENRA